MGSNKNLMLFAGFQCEHSNKTLKEYHFNDFKLKKYSHSSYLTYITYLTISLKIKKNRKNKTFRLWEKKGRGRWGIRGN